MFFSIPPAVLQDLKPYFETRVRFESRVNRDFNSTVDDGRSDLLSRVRVGARGKLADKVRFDVQYQYAHDLAWTLGNNFSTENSDVSLANVELDNQGWSFTVGRQKISVGDERLIGSNDWHNVGRSFDGVRAQSVDWDLWAARVGLDSPRPRDVVLAGITRKRLGPGDLSLFLKKDELPAGDVSLQTLNYLAKKDLFGMKLSAEGALQVGRNAGMDHRAWALNARLTRPLTSALSVYVEGSAASGGSDADTVFRFDNLYPTNHDKYGILDTQGWTNMNHVAVGAEYHPSPNIGFRVSYHAFELRDPSDAWYGANGLPNPRISGIYQDPTGASGRTLGQEIDIDVRARVNDRISVAFGGASFTPGDFVRLVGGQNDRQNWGYFQVEVKF